MPSDLLSLEDSALNSVEPRFGQFSEPHANPPSKVYRIYGSRLRGVLDGRPPCFLLTNTAMGANIPPHQQQQQLAGPVLVWNMSDKFATKRQTTACRIRMPG
jgi:hypothetical protein